MIEPAYILIFVLAANSFGGYGYPATATFDDRKACELAIAQIKAVGYPRFAFCTPVSTTKGPTE